ncbi:hypothetical protein, partial [Moorena sp. SIO3H5]|uniref:hypothetical protein n=1 Tax=Moorena sp. SIO3H5 TaxID=2607834 RepID=UPI0025CF18AE
VSYILFFSKWVGKGASFIKKDSNSFQGLPQTGHQPKIIAILGLTQIPQVNATCRVGKVLPTLPMDSVRKS